MTAYTGLCAEAERPPAMLAVGDTVVPRTPAGVHMRPCAIRHWHQTSTSVGVLCGPAQVVAVECNLLEWTETDEHDEEIPCSMWYEDAMVKSDDLTGWVGSGALVKVKST